MSNLNTSLKVCVATVWRTVSSAQMVQRAQPVMSDSNSMLVKGHANQSDVNKANTNKDLFVCSVSLAVTSANRHVMCRILFVPQPQFVNLAPLIFSSKLVLANSAVLHSIGKQSMVVYVLIAL